MNMLTFLSLLFGTLAEEILDLNDWGVQRGENFATHCLPRKAQKNSLCYAHTAGLPWTCGLKSVSMYFSSDGVTQQVHMSASSNW